MTIDEIRQCLGIRPEIPDDNVILSLEAIEYSWLLRPEVPNHHVVWDRLARQRDELAPPPDEAEIASLQEAIQQDDRTMEQFLESALDCPSTLGQSDSEEATGEAVIPDVASPAGDGSSIPPMFGSDNHRPTPLAEERKSKIPSRILGVTILLVVMAPVTVFLYSYWPERLAIVETTPAETIQSVQSNATSEKAAKGGHSTVPSTAQAGSKSQESSESNTEKTEPTKRLSWEKSRERMLARIRDRHGER